MKAVSEDKLRAFLEIGWGEGSGSGEGWGEGEGSGSGWGSGSPSCAALSTATTEPSG